MSAAACNNGHDIEIEEPIIPDAPTYTFSLTANMDEESTKTAYANDKIFSWSAEDQISVLFHNGDVNKFFTLTNTTGAGTSATFSGEIETGYTVGSSNAEKIALFPAGDHYYDRVKAKYDATNYPKRGAFFNIPSLTDFTETHVSANLPMAALGDDDNVFAFKHLSGSYKVVFKDIDPSVTKVKLEVKNQIERALSGDFRLEDGGSHLYTWWWTYAAEGSSAQSVSYIVNVVDGKATFYIPYAHNDDTGFQPVFTLTNAADGSILRKLSAKAPFSGNNKPSYHHMVVLPEIPVSGGTQSAINLTFTETDGDVVNPERGLYKHVEYKFNGSIPTTTIGNYDETLILTIFYLQDFVSSSTLSDAALDKIDSEWAKARQKGKKLIVRFAYNPKDSTPHEPSPANILNHLEQLRDKFTKYEDIIYLVQAGFIGTYGEWYYVDDAFKFTVSGNTVSGYENRQAVVDKMLDVIPSSRQIAVRTSFYKRYYLSPTAINNWTSISSWGTSANQRIGFYNDGFRGSSNDIGTFKSDEDRNMWYSQGEWLVCGGESAYAGKDYDGNGTTTVAEKQRWLEENASLVDPDASIAALRQQHFSYLHNSPTNILMDYWAGTSDSGGNFSWGGENKLPEFIKALGYRLVLNSANFTYSALTSGQSVNYSVSIQNKGCARVIYPRPCKLVLIHNGTATALVDNLLDVRSLAPDAAATVVSGSFTLPYTPSSGDQLAIWLPDNAEGLQSTAAYSIQPAGAGL